MRDQMHKKPKKRTSAVVDEIIRFGTTATIISGGMVAPGLFIALEKPMEKLYGILDERAREREIRKLIYYMKEKCYLAGDYEHGLQLTEKARVRLQKCSLDNIVIKPQPTWDKHWRIVLYDIPEGRKYSRDMLTSTLRLAGFYQLQRSVWITPFPCLDLIELLCAQYRIDDFVSYFEASQLANDIALLEHVTKKYPDTKF